MILPNLMKQKIIRIRKREENVKPIKIVGKCKMAGKNDRQKMMSKTKAYHKMRII
jgi:hypothetical protein